MDGSKVSFKTTVNGLIIDMNKECDFQSILEQIENKILSAGKFFDGASLTVKYRGRELTTFEESKVHSLLLDKTGAEIKVFDKFNENDISEVNDDVKEQIKGKKDFFKDIEEGITKFCKGTIRSGQLIKYDGNVVVVGDVNPGGVIIANGNVVVIGNLRGIVHAGADGNKMAYIIALNINPVQIRIANIITRSPDERFVNDSGLKSPEIAYK